jgi:hypothetical protein
LRGAARLAIVAAMQQFEKFRASELYCPKCRTARPVRERLLLVLPHAELFEYRCTVCASSLGEREAKAPPLGAAVPRVAPRSPPHPHAGSRRMPRAFLGGRPS